MLTMMDGSGGGRKQRIAVIGSGITGLSAAWLLSKAADVTLFEAADRPGGHSNTVEVETADGVLPVDTGFIVYNALNYPNLVALFEHLGVPTKASDMSFSASLDNGGFEYSGSSLATLLGQKSNIVSFRFWSMLADILRFYRQARFAGTLPEADTMTLGEYLVRERYSKAFIEDHILPMGAAIWSTTVNEMRAYPLTAFLRFFQNHGLVSLTNRPLWRTVDGGSREYVSRILADFRGRLRLSSPVRQVTRTGRGVEIVVEGAGVEQFDDVVIATHADQALAMLSDADAGERTLLSRFTYTPNRAVLHTDTALMPKRRNVWSSWNYIGGQNESGEGQLCVTYWMNRLQGLDPRHQLFVTLNPAREIDPAKIHAVFDYEHPLFDVEAMAAQKEIWRIQGRGGVWFCGAHCGSGFHEDGLQAGLAVAEAVGQVRRPWTVAEESGRIFLDAPLMAAQ